jgi:acyl carrier protein
MQVEKVVIRCMQKLSSNKKIDSDSSLKNDLGMDSMKIISLGLMLEAKLGISIVDLSENIDFISDITAGQIILLVKQLQKGKYV